MGRKPLNGIFAMSNKQRQAKYKSTLRDRAVLAERKANEAIGNLELINNNPSEFELFNCISELRDENRELLELYRNIKIENETLRSQLRDALRPKKYVLDSKDMTRLCKFLDQLSNENDNIRDIASLAIEKLRQKYNKYWSNLLKVL